MVFESLKKSLGFGNSSSSFSGKGHVLGSANTNANESTKSTARGSSATPQPASSSANLSVPPNPPNYARSSSAPVAGLTQSTPYAPIPVSAAQPQPQLQPPPTPQTASVSSNPSPLQPHQSSTPNIAKNVHNTEAGTQYVNETKENYLVFEVIFYQERLGMSINEYKDQLPIDKVNGSSSKRQLISRPIVSEVKFNSEAEQLGVRQGDVIISLNRHQLTGFHEFHSHIGTFGRPLKVQFYRPLTSTSSSTSTKAISPISTTFRMLGQKDTSKQHIPPAVSAEEERAKRDAIRNAAMERAQAWDKKVSKSSSARNKENHEVGSLGGKSNGDSQQQDQPISEETLRSVRMVKEGEMKTEQQFGYSPFRPHMSFTGNSVNSISSNAGPNVSSGNAEAPPASSVSAPSPSRIASMYRISPSTTMLAPSPRRQRPSPQTLPQGLHPQPLAQPFRPLASAGRSPSPVTGNVSVSVDIISPLPTPAIPALPPAPPASTSIQSNNKVAAPPKTSTEEDQELAQMIADVDDAFAMLISLSESNQPHDLERVQIAIQTIQKMLLNLFNHKDDLKFRSIRISNPTFHKKVGQVSGGVELLLAAGFKFDCSPVEGFPLMTSRSAENLMLTTNSVDLSRSTSSSKQLSLSQLSLDASVSNNPHGDEYLVHSMNVIAERRLGYTISRLSELAGVLKS